MQFKTVKFEFKSPEGGSQAMWSEQKVEQIRDFIESQIESVGAQLWFSPDICTVLACGKNRRGTNLLINESPDTSAIRYGYIDFGNDIIYSYVLDMYAVNEKAEDDGSVIIRHDNGLIKVLDFSNCLFQKIVGSV